MYAKTMNTRTETTKPRRGSKPRQWTKRIVLTTRILPATNARLTAAAEKTGLGPQAITEDALNDLFDRMGIPTADQLDQGEQS